MKQTFASRAATTATIVALAVATFRGLLAAPRPAGATQNAALPADAPLIKPGDLVYVGAFRLPAGKFGGSTISYGGTALTFGPERRS